MNESDLKDIVFEENDFNPVGDAQNVNIDKNFVNISVAKDAFNRFRKNRGAVIALLIILLIVFMSLVGPGMNEYNYREMDTKLHSLPPRIKGLEKLGIFDGKVDGVDMYAKVNASDKYFWFGTDPLGRDLWTRVWAGTRVSLMIAFIAAGGSLVIGVIYGLVSGYIGGRVDSVMQRIIEIINGIPSLVIMTLMVMVMKPGVKSITIALLMTGWIGMARMVRGQAMKLKTSQFVMASQTLGTSSSKIMRKDILPNTLSQIIIICMFSIPGSIFAESFLAFVGLGLPQPQPSLGILISEGYKTLTLHPYQLFIPVIILSLLMMCFNIFADGLRDALDPKMKDR